MGNNAFGHYSELLNCLDQPAFLVQDREILLTNRKSLPVEEVLRALLETADLQAPSVVVRNNWTFTVRPLSDVMLVLAAKAPDPAFDPAITQALRLPLNDLFSTAVTLLPCFEEIEDPVLQRSAAALNQGLYRLLRSAANIETLHAEQLTPKKETVELTAFLQAIWDKSEPLCRLAQASLRLEMPDRLIRILADWQLLERSVMNLLSNAIRHSDKGTVITLRLTTSRGQALIEVRNESSRPIVLSEVFGRGETGPSDPSHGAGLGLQLVRRIAQLHDGVFLFRPLDRGASAVLAFPISKEPTVTLRSPILRPDYTGGFSHTLVELADVLPPEVFGTMCID